MIRSFFVSCLPCQDVAIPVPSAALLFEVHALCFDPRWEAAIVKGGESRGNGLGNGIIRQITHVMGVGDQEWLYFSQ
jgi:hypothetical protein